MKHYTKYYYSKTNGMKLRNGKIINCIANTKFALDTNELNYEIDVIMKHNNVNKCRIVQNFINYLNNYYYLLKNNNNLITFYYNVKRKLERVIIQLNKLIYNNINICMCKFVGYKQINNTNNQNNIINEVNNNIIVLTYIPMYQTIHPLSEKLIIIKLLKNKYSNIHNTHIKVFNKIVELTNIDCSNKIFEYL
jgi:hypothetical protein